MAKTPTQSDKGTIGRPHLRRRLAFAAVALLVSTGAAAAPKPVPAHLAAVREVPAPLAAENLCRQHAWACAGGGRKSTAPETALTLARSVNRAVNAEVRSISDAAQYGREDLWALPTARGGDCEDFVLAKKKRLVEAGLPGASLMIATVLDRRRDPHAVLVLRTRSSDYVLDNVTDRIVPWHKTGYSFLRMQSPVEPRRWNAIAAGGIFATASR